MTIDQKQDCFVSVVSTIHDDQEIVESFVRLVSKVLEENFTNHELVLIDRRSTDNTVEKVEALLLGQISNVRLIKLSTPVREEIAWSAGLENAIGDFVVMVTPGVDPPNCIPEIVEQCRAGSDVVLGVAEQLSQTLGYRIVRPFIQWVLVSIGYTLPKNVTNLRCLSRRAVNAVTDTGRFHQRLSMRITSTGYRYSEYRYRFDTRHPEKRSLCSGAREALYLIIFNSTRPLRWMSGIGLVGSLMAFLFAAYSIVVHLFKNNVVEGWTSLMLVNSLLLAMVFTILAFFGEYLGRLLNEQRDQRDYHVVFEKNSSVMLDENRYNVLSESTSEFKNLVQTGRDR